jgi:hypothetical protein
MSIDLQRFSCVTVHLAGINEPGNRQLGRRVALTVKQEHLACHTFNHQRRRTT